MIFAAKALGRHVASAVVVEVAEALVVIGDVLRLNVGGLVADHVGHVQLVVRRDQHVFRFQVAVDERFLMNMAYRAQQLKHEPFLFDHGHFWNLVFHFLEKAEVDELAVGHIQRPLPIFDRA